MYTPRKLALTSLFAITVVLLAFSLAVAQQPKGITVTGTAEVSGNPDIAYVTFGVVTEDANAAQAAQENAAKSNAVINAIIKSGIPKSDIQTIQYTIYPQTRYPGPNETSKTPVTIYQVSNLIKVKMHDLSKIGTLIDAAVSAGANNIQNVTFTVENQDPLRRQALAQAVKNAKTKAVVIADALGVKLGKVISASESTGFTPRPFEMGFKSAEAATPIIPGQVEVNANVTLVYGIL